MSASAFLDDLNMIGNVADRTRTVLAKALDDVELDARARTTLDTTLEHLSDVREGFILSFRAVGSGADSSELYDLVRYTLASVGLPMLQALELDFEPDDTIHLPHLQLIAFAHTYLTMAHLPHLPRQWVTFPQPRSYADIPVPRRPGEVLDRIEELERVLTRLLLARSTFAGDALRRTYGFFEASAWLIRDQMRLFQNPND